ncbi:hypothetical protein E5D57_011963 [Metarhizium anisopliae]|nr:hypothetical protein E5D57_011963 [Metarhizium anisopliae]
MIGRTKKTASPTVLFISGNNHYRKEARKVIKESGILEQHPGFKTAHTSRDPGWGGPLEQLGLCQETKASIKGQKDGPETEVFYEYSKALQPAMPIYIRNGSSTRVATANAIRLHGHLFYLAPSHVFFARLDTSQTSQMDDDFEMDSESESEREYDGVVEASITSTGSQSTEALSDHDDLSDDGKHSKPALDSPQITNTIASPPRPRRFSNSSFAEGQIRYPQRKITTPPWASLRHLGVLFDWCVDQDWALVEVTESPDPNISSFLSFLSSNRLDLSAAPIAALPRDGAAVITHTASAGQVTGSILGMPSYARLPRGKSFQEVFSIHLDGPLTDGDCGSAIREAGTGKLFGHIVAGCRSTGFAYVMAARHVFPKLVKSALRIKDMERRNERCPIVFNQDTALEWKGKHQEMLLPSEPQSQPNTTIKPPAVGHETAVPETRARVDLQEVQQTAGHTERPTQGLHLASRAQPQSPGSVRRRHAPTLALDPLWLPPMYTTHPPKYGPKPVGSQLSKVYEDSRILLPCEFREFSGCQKQFALRDKDLWIDHIIDEHLHRRYPRVSICWFCDKPVFRSGLDQKGDRLQSFRQRMDHIATHFKEGMTAADIRPDFHFLDHLHEHNLIDESTFRSAKKLGEFPGGYSPRPPRGNETQSEVVVESSRSCRRRQSRDCQPGSSTKPNST